ncbi:MAG: hypothetical protein EBY23_13130, partial [Actinobacteria bacterium]|nr:hypothetical protein [Actinomycetota bacterium]
ITRGLAEMARLGTAMGGTPATFAGLAGMGDLIATCSSLQSRNTSVGMALGRGENIADVVASMQMVAEGVKSSAAVLDLATQFGIEMPITEHTFANITRTHRHTRGHIHGFCFAMGRHHASRRFGGACLACCR